MTTRRHLITGAASVPIAAIMPVWTIAAVIDPAFPYTMAEIERMTPAQREQVATVSLWPDAADRDRYCLNRRAA